MKKAEDMDAIQTEEPKRKAAPSGLRFNARGRDLRKELLDRLDTENPEFVHSYQSPDIFGPNAERLTWDMEVKGQDLVKRPDGKYENHMGDPVVRQPKERFMAERQAECDFSREMVESRVKPENSTLIRSQKKPIMGKEK